MIDPDTGKITGYKTKVGADTVFPFRTCNMCFEKREGSYTIPAYSSIEFSSTQLSKIVGILGNVKWSNTYRFILLKEIVDYNGVNHGSMISGNDIELVSVDDSTISMKNLYQGRCILTDVYLIGYP